MDARFKRERERLKSQVLSGTQRVQSACGLDNKVLEKVLTALPEWQEKVKQQVTWCKFAPVKLIKMIPIGDLIRNI